MKTFTSSGALVPGAKIVKRANDLSPEEAKVKIEEGKVVAQALFLALEPYAIAQVEHPAFAGL